jgi:predicted Zn-dependent protease
VKYLPVPAFLLLLAACSTEATLTESQEYYAGRAACADVLNEYNVYEDEALTSYITDMGYLMARASDRPETYHGYHFAILDTNELNAFTAPSGFTFITKGLLMLCQNEDELAAVIAHELGHSVLRHPEREARAAANASKFAEFMGKVANVIRESSNAEEKRKLANLFEDVSKRVSQAYADGYGSEQELEADHTAAVLMSNVGYDPHALITLLGRMGSSAEKGWNSNKYPTVDERVHEVRKAIKKGNLTGTVDPARTARFEKMTAKIKGGR